MRDPFDCSGIPAGGGIIWPLSVHLRDYPWEPDPGSIDNTERCPVHDDFGDWDIECTCDDGVGFICEGIWLNLQWDWPDGVVSDPDIASPCPGCARPVPSGLALLCPVCNPDEPGTPRNVADWDDFLDHARAFGD